MSESEERIPCCISYSIPFSQNVDTRRLTEQPPRSLSLLSTPREVLKHYLTSSNQHRRIYPVSLLRGPRSLVNSMRQVGDSTNSSVELQVEPPHAPDIRREGSSSTQHRLIVGASRGKSSLFGALGKSGLGRMVTV